MNISRHAKVGLAGRVGEVVKVGKGVRVGRGVEMVDGGRGSGEDKDGNGQMIGC